MEHQELLIGYAATPERAQGFSAAAQRERLELEAHALGAELLRVETDTGAAAQLEPLRRPGLQRALSALAGGEADGILTLKLDRLARSLRDVLQLARMGARDGWRLCSTYERLDTDTLEGRYALSLLGAVSALGREHVAARTREAMDQLGREGRPRSGRLPFGYRSRAHPERITAVAGDRAALVEHAGEQRLLAEMQRLHARGLGARRIARTLNERGEPHPRTGRAWRPSTVQKILNTALRTPAPGATPGE